MVDNKISRKGGKASDVKEVELTFSELKKLGFEVAEEKLVVGAGEELENVVVVFHKMLKKVKVNRVGCFTGEDVPVGAVAIFSAVKNVAEKLTAKLFEKIVLCFEVAVKGCSSHIGKVDYFFDGDLTCAFL